MLIVFSRFAVDLVVCSAAIFTCVCICGKRVNVDCIFQVRCRSRSLLSCDI